MPGSLIDTDILADFFRKKQYAKTLVYQLLKREVLYVSALTIAELRTGFTPEQSEFFLPKLYTIVVIKEVTREIAERAGALRFEYARKGKSLSMIDTIIAATALLNNYQLITRNQKDYPMPEIQLYEF